MKSEDEVAQEILIALRAFDCHLLRNNSGALPDATGRPVRFGLGNVSKELNKVWKSSDYIGIWNGMWVAIEVKKEGWFFNPFDEHEVAQLHFLEWVIMRGGYAGFASSVDEALRIIGR